MNSQYTRGDIGAYTYNDKPCRGIVLDVLHTGRVLVCHTLAKGEYIPLVLDEVQRVVRNDGLMPEWAPYWACTFGKGRKHQ